MKKAIPYGRQHITQADIDAVNKVLVHDYLTTGPKVKQFEEAFAAYVGSKYAVAVSNGTAALHLCALSLGVNEESRVITTPITFAASANCVRYCGGQVDFCDIDPTTLTLDIEQVRAKLEAAPKGTYQGIIPVDFAGYPVNLEAFRALADEYGLWIIEDACHAPGGWFTDSKGVQQRCGGGQYADLAIFSFHPVKHIACGEGGMITTNSESHYHKLLQLRSHGMIYQGNPDLIENHGRWYMELQDLGYNYRIPDILCALGLSQLDRAEQGIKRRRAIAARYDEVFAGTSIKTHLPEQGIGHAYHLYVIEVKNRKALYDALREEQIYAQRHYVPVHLMPDYRQFGHKKGDRPLAEAYYEGCISLPMYPNL
ncbi:MAG: UDP-4-amino-4,6-dideoxy-N-acetyl-beta-L-altrosamine transaminase, partial [Bacteroidota bacterium]